MIPRAFLPLFAVLGATTAPAAAQSATEPAFVGPQPPPQTWPIPAQAPPVVRGRTSDGRRVREQVWRVGPEMLRIRPLSIAQQRWIADRLAAAALAEPLSVTISCWIGPEGGVTPRCEPRGLPPSSPLYSVALRKGVSQQPYFSTFPAAPVDSRIVRRIEYRIALDPADRPPPLPDDARRFDPAAASAIVSLLQRRLRRDYPPAALAADMDALVTGQCRVEADHSLSCRTLAIAPDAARPYFEGAVEGIYPSGTVPETLTDGTPTAGLTFRVPIRYIVAR